MKSNCNLTCLPFCLFLCFLGFLLLVPDLTHGYLPTNTIPARIRNVTTTNYLLARRDVFPSRAHYFGRTRRRGFAWSSAPAYEGAPFRGWDWLAGPARLRSYAALGKLVVTYCVVHRVVRGRTPNSGMYLHRYPGTDHIIYNVNAGLLAIARISNLASTY